MSGTTGSASNVSRVLHLVRLSVSFRIICTIRYTKETCWRSALLVASSRSIRARQTAVPSCYWRGIGATPLLSMLKSLAHHGVKTPIHFIHAARNSRLHPFAKEVRDLAAQHSNIHPHFRYDTPLAEDLHHRHCDSTGLVDMALLQQLKTGPKAEFYLCGPKPFMVHLYRGLKSWGVDNSQIHFEFFGPKEEITQDAA